MKNHVLAVTSSFLFASILTIGSSAAEIISEEEARQFSEHAEQSAYRIDHAPWSDFMLSAVYDVGMSSRRPAPRRKSGVSTGTRVSTGSRSRYRFEANRVLYHLFDDGVQRYLTAYRTGLQSAMTEIEYSDLGSDEQLAFWLNLYTVVLMDELGQHYPVSRPNAFRLRDYGNKSLFEAKLVVVNDVSLSLNDIRYGIVYRYWDNPNVLYGFWDGSIGGPDIQPTAYNGQNVWNVLGSGARRYVNSLRGVDPISGSFRVSKIYDDAQFMFQNWPQSLYSHLKTHANAEVSELLLSEPQKVRFIRSDTALADINSGERARFGGSDNAAAALSSKATVGSQGFDDPINTMILQNFGAPLNSPALRGGLSDDAIKMNHRLREERLRQRREGEATIEDIPTEDPEAPEEGPDESDEDQGNEAGEENQSGDDE